MPTQDPRPPRFASLSQFFEQPEELATVEELGALGPWSYSSLRWWINNADTNGLEKALVRPNARRLYIHSGRFRQWLDQRTEMVRRQRGIQI